MVKRLNGQQDQSYGLPKPLSNIFPTPVVARRAPTTLDLGYSIGQIWVNRAAGNIYCLGANAGGIATWATLGGPTADVNTLSGDSGGNLSPTAGNIAIAGGTKIATVGSGSTITINLDAGTSAVRSTELVSDGNFLQSYGVTTGLPVGTSYKAFRGDISVVTGDGSESPQAVRGSIGINAASHVEEGYAGYFAASQANGSVIDSNLIGSLGFTSVLETNAVDQPQQWIAGGQNIVSFDAAAAVPTASIVCANLNHVTYDAPMNTIAHGVVVSRNGAGAGSTAGAAYKVIIGGALDDWTYGLDLYTGSLANNYSTADIRLAQQNTIASGSGFPAAASAAGSMYVRSDGPADDNVLYVNNDGTATSWRPVLRDPSLTTWIDSFNQSPILQSILDTGAAPSGTTGDVNLMMLQGGDVMQQFIIGAGQTIIAPRMDTNGLLVSLDLVATEGAEYNWGMTPISKHSFTIGTSQAFTFMVRFTVADVSGATPVLMGFRKQSANNADYTTYTDYALIGLNSGVNVGTVIIEDRLNGGAAVQTDTTNAWIDTATHTLRVNVSNAGVVTYAIDGAAPSVTHAFTFDNGDIVSPFFYLVHGVVAPGAIEWNSMACGLV